MSVASHIAGIVRRTREHERASGQPTPASAPSRPRWSVCRGGYPNGWEPPLVETDDPREAVRVYAEATENAGRTTLVAIFDDHGEGEPLDPDRVNERLDAEGNARVVETINRIRREDSDFITPETIQTYTGCSNEQARAGIVAVFGQEWLDRQDASSIELRLRVAGWTKFARNGVHVGWRDPDGVLYSDERAVEAAVDKAAVFGQEPDRCPHGMFYSGAGACPKCGEPN